jgi:hypothetical protein
MVSVVALYPQPKQSTNGCPLLNECRHILWLHHTCNLVRDSGMGQRLAVQERVGAGFRFVLLTLQILSAQ